MKEKTEKTTRWRHTLRWRLTLFVFAMMVCSSSLTFFIYTLIVIFFHKTPLVMALTLNPIFLFAILLLISAAFGVILSSVFGNFYLRPIKALSKATREVKSGNFKTQVDPRVSPPITEMGQLVDHFNEMVRELDGIELFRNDFINNFSHEFKTPIVSIRGFAKELQLGELDEAQRLEYAKIIAEEADRLARLATNVLELSKLENQQIVTNKQVFSLDEQLRQCILLQEKAWTEKSLDILPELEEVRFFGNEELLAHIWTNLLSNAIKFTPEGGSVSISLSENENDVTVRISDTGCGMSDEVRAHIFEKFYQGDLSHHKKGYGIGLTMAHRAAELCGGKIDVASEVLRGSTFTVTLPKQGNQK